MLKQVTIFKFFQRPLLLTAQPYSTAWATVIRREHALFTIWNGFKNSSRSDARQPETSWYFAEVENFFEEVNPNSVSCETILQLIQEGESCKIEILFFSQSMFFCSQEMMGSERGGDGIIGDAHTRTLCEEGIKVSCSVLRTGYWSSIAHWSDWWRSGACGDLSWECASSLCQLHRVWVEAGEGQPDIFALLLCFNLLIAFVYEQMDNMDSLLCCPHCNLLHYCSLECQEEHWVKVHHKHCSSLAASVVPTTYMHKEEECNQCLAVAAQGGLQAVSEQQSPVYPCTEMQKTVWIAN